MLVESRYFIKSGPKWLFMVHSWKFVLLQMLRLMAGEMSIIVQWYLRKKFHHRCFTGSLIKSHLASASQDFQWFRLSSFFLFYFIPNVEILFETPAMEFCFQNEKCSVFRHFQIAPIIQMVFKSSLRRVQFWLICDAGMDWWLANVIRILADIKWQIF